ncbi:MAG: hypothetical protein GYB65_22980 [Chloroflexi bacterium]|nr:hypothetical protein [Chloroflexota bacterium]
MWFTWKKKNDDSYEPVEQTGTNTLIYIAYNAVWWVPILLTLLGVIDHMSGTIGFAAITALRLAANLYRTNVLDPVQAMNFPFRA